MAFLLDKLTALAPKETVSTGIRLSADGSVLIRSHAPGLVVASVRDEGGRQCDVVIEYGPELSEIEAVSCNCSQFAKDENVFLCRHIVAAALKAGRILPANSVEEAEKMRARFEGRGGIPPRRVPELPGIGETPALAAKRPDGTHGTGLAATTGSRGGPAPIPPSLPSERRTDFYASQLLRDTAARASRLAGAGFKDEPLRLEALLDLGHDGLAHLSFRVGSGDGGHMYVVRNLKEFVGGFKAGDSFALGTKRSIVLQRNAFGAGSLPALDFLLGRYDPMSNGFPGRAKDRRNMVLSPGEADAFLAAACSVSMKARTYEERRETPVKDKDCRLRVRIEKADDETGSGLVLRAMDPYALIEGVRHIYIISDDGLCRCGEEYSSACRDLLKTLASRKGGLYFSGKDVPALFATIVRKAEPWLEIEMDGGVGELAPPELETKVYFDMNDAGYVTARMVFSYGDIVHDAFEEPRRPEASLDPAGEAYAEHTLWHYIGHATYGPGTLILLDNASREERLYTLATEGMDKIREFAEVFVSESFDTLKARPPMGISVGVKVNGRLLTLNINADGVDFSELAEILKSYRLAKKYHRLRDGSFIELEGAALGELADLTESLDLDPARFVEDEGDPGQSSIELDLSRALYIDAMMRKNDSIRYDRDKNFRGLLRNFSDVANADYQPPDRLSGILRNYQETGFRWLRTMDALGFGGILADDMGLGKTLQILALLSAIKAEEPPKDRLPSIVVCPSSLMLNWESESAKFTPGLNVCVVIGPADARRMIIEKARMARSGKKAGQAPDLLVTSYDLLKRDIKAYEGMEFRFVVIDEAQYIKNQLTQNAKSVKLLTSRTRFALTGTPIENTLAELWSIFDFLMPGYLFRYSQFQRRFETPIVKRTDLGAENRLKEMVRPFIMRRLKKDVLKELPEKIETVLKSEMGSEQHKLYIANMASTKKELADKLAAAGAPGAKFAILAALMRMRRICCDPALVYENYSGGSAKLDACMELVESCIASGHRILLFSQFTSMLDRIEARLWDAKIDWYRLDGSTPSAERHTLMNNFNSGDMPVFLISLRAGGTGLNLAGADIVIHYDPWWNISVQNQATDRAHRIGQTSRVQVFKLITKDTIEERIMEMQERKADLADRIIREGGDAFGSLTEEELMKLFE